jgi:hypothetical protein
MMDNILPCPCYLHSHRCLEVTMLCDRSDYCSAASPQKLVRGARAYDTPLTRANHTSWGTVISCPQHSQVSCGGLLGKKPHFHIPSARPLVHPIIYPVYPLKRGPCLGCPRHLPHGIFSMAFSSVSLSPSQRRQSSRRTGDV